MADDKKTISFTKILVALDSSQHSRAALELAAIIAKQMEANLQGLFVHDAQWLRVSRLPTAFEVNERTGEVTPIAQDSIEKQIKLLEQKIKEHFELISEQNKLKHTWTSVQGAVRDKVLEAARDADLITIGKIGRSFYKSGKLGSTAKAVIQETDKPVLILQEGFRFTNKIITVYDGTDACLSSVKLAALLAEKNNNKLLVIDLTHGTSEASEIENKLVQLLNDPLQDFDILTLKDPNIGKFLFWLSRLNGGLLVIPKTERFIKNSNIERILEAINSPVLLMT
jgi:nucleotide-binding universal stress UspA family protein